MKRLIAVAVVAILGGCVSAEERAARMQQERAQQQAAHEAQARAYRENLTRQCAAIGYQAGTEGMRQCILQLHSNNQASDAQMRSVIMQQLLQQQQQQDYRSMPRCATLPPGTRGYMQAQGTCR